MVIMEVYKKLCQPPATPFILRWCWKLRTQYRRIRGSICLKNTCTVAIPHLEGSIVPNFKTIRTVHQHGCRMTNLNRRHDNSSALHSVTQFTAWVEITSLRLNRLAKRKLQPTPTSILGFGAGKKIYRLCGFATVVISIGLLVLYNSMG